MKKLFAGALRLISEYKRYQPAIMLVIIVAMFVMAASAPNATIGIGK